MIPPEPHPKRGIRLVHRSGSLTCAGQTFPAPTIMVKVYFETSSPSYSEQVATFDNEETYKACLPALWNLMEERRFVCITESVEEARIGKPEDLLTDGELFAELERRGYAVRHGWGKTHVQQNYDVSADEAVEIMNDVLMTEQVEDYIFEYISEIAESRGHAKK